MSTFAIGLKAIKKLVVEQAPMNWYRAKLGTQMFKGEETAVYEWTADFVRKHHELPKLETLEQKFPGVLDGHEVPEPSTYYIEHLENRYVYDLVNATNLESQAVLKEGPQNGSKAVALLEETLWKIKSQQYRQKIVNVADEGPQMVLAAYHNLEAVENVGRFGWPYMDDMTHGQMPGDVISYVGRPQQGKTFLLLNEALVNWRDGKNVLFVSMEMSPLPIIQRLSSMYAHTNLTQLKAGGYSSSTYKKFADGLIGMAQEDAGLWVVDGNLAASVEDVYMLAAQLRCALVKIDGAYMLKHKNPRLDRFTRVAENIELIKQATTNLGMPSSLSYQFSREAAKKKKEGGEVGLEDIGYSDAIGQISSIVLGLFQEESVETLNSRQIRLLKGRGGEIGQFNINWNFASMDFTQLGVNESKPEELPDEYI